MYGGTHGNQNSLAEPSHVNSTENNVKVSGLMLSIES